MQCLCPCNVYVRAAVLRSCVLARRGQRGIPRPSVLHALAVHSSARPITSPRPSDAANFPPTRCCCAHDARGARGVQRRSPGRPQPTSRCPVMRAYRGRRSSGDRPRTHKHVGRALPSWRPRHKAQGCSGPRAGAAPQIFPGQCTGAVRQLRRRLWRSISVLSAFCQRPRFCQRPITFCQCPVPARAGGSRRGCAGVVALMPRTAVARRFCCRPVGNAGCF